MQRIQRGLVRAGIVMSAKPVLGDNDVGELGSAVATTATSGKVLLLYLILLANTCGARGPLTTTWLHGGSLQPPGWITWMMPELTA